MCTEANVNHRIQINSPMEEIPVTLTGLLPGCTYTVTASAIDNNGNTVSATSCDLETNDDHGTIYLNTYIYIHKYIHIYT